MIEIISAPVFTFDCRLYDKQGRLRWREKVHNLVTTEGKNDLLDKYFAGSAYTAAWYFGLISGSSFTAVAATDIGANINSGNGWQEAGSGNSPVYSQATRPAASFAAAASAGSKQTSASSTFTITTGANLFGVFLCSANVKAAQGGILYCAAEIALHPATTTGENLTVSATVSC